MSSIIEYQDPEMLNVLRNTIAKDATNDEFKMFVEFCKATGLNPFKKEIWFIKVRGQIQIMTGINGFYTIANSHPQFDGIENEIVENNGKILKAVSKVYRKDRRIPSKAEAYFAEYGKTTGTWVSMPRVMLSKCAESMALRKAFPQELNGLYTQEEMPSQYALRTKEPIEEEEVTRAEEIKHYYDFSEVEKEADKYTWLYDNVLEPFNADEIGDGVYALEGKVQSPKFEKMYLGTALPEQKDKDKDCVFPEA